MCRVEGNGKAVMPYSVMRGDVKRHDVMRGGTFLFLGGREATPTAEDLHGLLRAQPPSSVRKSQPGYLRTTLRGQSLSATSQWQATMSPL